MGQRKYIKCVAALLGAAALTISNAKLTYASLADDKANFGMDMGYYKNSIPLRNLLSLDKNKEALSTALIKWNSCSTGYSFYQYSIANNYVLEKSNLDKDVCGEYRWLIYDSDETWRKTTSFSIAIRANDDTTATWDDLWGLNWRIGTMSHELGLALSLLDLDTGEGENQYAGKINYELLQR